jgi:hypothetical protein
MRILPRRRPTLTPWESLGLTNKAGCGRGKARGLKDPRARRSGRSNHPPYQSRASVRSKYALA